jgi:hypothetical protein
MNKAQRAELQTEVVDKITQIIEDLGEEGLGGTDLDSIKEAVSAAEGVTSAMADQEREKFGNMSEGLQGSENGQKLEEAADKLENLCWPDIPEELNDETAAVLAEELQSVLTEVEELL